MEASGPAQPANPADDETTAAVNRVVRRSFDSAPDGVAVLGGDGRLLVCNPRFATLWKFPEAMLARAEPAEMRRHVAAQLADPAAYRRSLKAFRDTGADQQFSPMALLDGRVFERHISRLHALPGLPATEGGHIVRWRDVTQRHRAEQRQRELSALLELALDGADLAYWDVDLQTGQVHAQNERWHAILGYGPQYAPKGHAAWGALVHPDDAAARETAWAAHLSGAAPRYETEFRMRHRQGHWVWLQARGQVVARAGDGTPLRLVGTRQDITHRKHTEQWLRTLAHTDSLTGIANRRRFLELAAEELGRARRYGQALTLLMIDLDRFKDVNDQHGHAAGDEVLRCFVQTARTVMRQSDVFARIGGEEFAALLPHTDLGGAQAIAERLRLRVVGTPACLPDGHTVPYTISVGVASASTQAGGESEAGSEDAGGPIEQLMAVADQLLYSAKSQGRDRVVVALAG